ADTQAHPRDTRQRPASGPERRATSRHPALGTWLWAPNNGHPTLGIPRWLGAPTGADADRMSRGNDGPTRPSPVAFELLIGGSVGHESRVRRTTRFTCVVRALWCGNHTATLLPSAA
ncbi:MAG: hypothetical protein ACRCYU_20415, partial [Nocardioides sp.]